MNKIKQRFISWLYFKLGIASPSRLVVDASYRECVYDAPQFAINRESPQVVVEKHNDAEQEVEDAN